MRGLPINIVEKKEASCMGNAWLMGALLLRSGIAPLQLTYAHAEQLSDGSIVPHGMIFVRATDGNFFLVDRFKTTGQTFFEGGSTITQEAALILHGSPQGCGIVTAPDINARVLQMPRWMVVSPIFHGIASEHLLNIGLKFFHEGKIAEAERAFLLAFSFCPQRPDILHQLGQVERRKGNEVLAKEYFDTAVQLFESDIASHFYLGDIARLQGNHGEARKRFERVQKEKNTIWGDDAFRKKAEEFLKEYEQEEKPHDAFVPMYEI